MNACVKCRDESTSDVIIEGGESYRFCKECHEYLKDNPNHNVYSYLRSHQEGKVAKNIRQAQERRARGDFLWA